MLRKRSPPIEPGSWRRAQHRHALGLEEGFEGGNDRRVVALVDMGAVCLGRSDGELELEDSLLELAGDIEPGVPEDAQHASVLGQDDRNEPLDAVSACEGRQLLEQPRSDPSTLELVRHRERNLGLGGITEPVIGRDRDDAVATVRAQSPDQRAALGPVRIQDPLDERRCERGHAVEAEVKALGREPLEERQQRIGVGVDRRAQPERASVPEDDVEGLRSHRVATIMPLAGEGALDAARRRPRR